MAQPHRAGKLPDGRRLVRMAEETDAFKLRRHEGITALNYAYVSGKPDQFDWPRSEMRGLMVDESTGGILARPFQKFWNFNEGNARDTDWNESHVVLPKLDGSLVYPAGHRWTTRGGVTDTSLRVEALAERIGRPLARLLEAVRTDPDDGAPCTPCFEYIGPDNQIVIRYKHNRLVLLAVRRITDGKYWNTDRMVATFREAAGETSSHEALDVVEPLGRTGAKRGADYVASLTQRVQQWSGDHEGVVVAFEPSGHRVKIKSLEYVALHRARDDYSTESRVLTVWSDGNARALCENLSANRRARLEQYYASLEECIRSAAAGIAAEAQETWSRNGGNRKNAAIEWTAATDKRIPVRAAGFTVFNAIARGHDAAAAAEEHIRKAIARACRHQSNIDQKARPLLGPDAPAWRPPDGNFADADQ